MFKFLRKFFARRFVAAQSGRLTADWVTSWIRTNDDIRRYLEVLIRRSRDLAKNNSDYRKYLDMRDRNVIGHKGIALQVKARNPDGAPDIYANTAIETHWAEWGRARNGCCCHDKQDVSWRQLSALVDRGFAVDGGALVQIVEGADNPYLFSLKLLDYLDCDIEKNIALLPGGGRIIMGVELDAADRPVAYHFRQQDDRVRPAYLRVPADQIIHLFKREFPGQVRGFPRGCAAILDLNMLDKYKETSLVGARAAAAQMGIWEPTVNTAAPFIPGQGASADLPGPPESEVSPGKIIVGKKGWSFKSFTPTQPVSAFADFVKAIWRSIANGLSVSYNDFANDLENVSFSSLRGGTLSERDGWMIDQAFLVESFCEVVYVRWLKMFLLSGLTTLPFGKFVKFLADRWMPRRWPWVDPKKDAEAAILLINNALIDPHTVIAETGADPDEVIEGAKAFAEKTAWLAPAPKPPITTPEEQDAETEVA